MSHSNSGIPPGAVRPPLACAPLWTAVMEHAGYRCECLGACGAKHADRRARQPGRCPRTHGEWVSKTGETVLTAAPVDPVGTWATAASLPANRLMALCPSCYDATRRIAQKITQQSSVPDGLFDAAEFYVAPASRKQADVGRA